MDAVGAAPEIITGDDGLPHCTRCMEDGALCRYHRKQVRMAIDHLQTSTILPSGHDGRWDPRKSIR